MKINKLSKITNLILLHIFKMIPKFITLITIKKNQMILQINPKRIYFTFFFLKNYTNTQIDYLSDICAVDYPKRVFRFEVIYNCLSIGFNSRFRIKTNIHELISLNSISLIFLNANWFEREIWDMFGLYFTEHYRLRRILTDYGFWGNPLRKDFPVSGFLEVRYNEEVQKVTYEPVQFTAVGRFLNNR
jgi:NADH dehydrogenase (ubiquinone) Fe-S protein 3